MQRKSTRKRNFLVPGPLHQNEVKCSAFDMEMIFHSHAKSSFSQERFCTWPHFETGGLWNWEVAYYDGF